MADVFDLIVLGSGPAATRVANRCAKERWRVAVVDPRPVGGTCALHGCNPKKVLVRAAELVDRARRMHGHGTSLGGAVIDWGDLVRFKRTFTEPVSEGKRQSFEELGIEIIQGGPQFTSPTELNVDGRRIEAAKILVATGAKPAPLPFEGAEFLTTSNEFMELSQLPKRVTFIGGGYISFEFAHVAVRSGVQVSIVEKAGHLRISTRTLLIVLSIVPGQSASNSTSRRASNPSNAGPTGRFSFISPLKEIRVKLKRTWSCTGPVGFRTSMG